MKVIDLYYNCTLNVEGGIHKYFTNPVSYYTWIVANHTLASSVDETSYLINTNRLRVKMNEIANYSQITYVVERDTTSNIFKFYHVQNSFYQSGMYYFDLSDDTWANNIDKCIFNNMLVKRSNKNIPDATGLFDEVEYTSQTETYTQTEIIEPDDTKCWIIYSVMYEIGESSLFGDTKATRVRLYANRLSNINTTHNPYVAQQQISSIIKISDSGGADTPANVLHAYIWQETDSLFAYRTVSGITLKTALADPYDKIVPEVEILPCTVTQRIDLSNKISPNAINYFGTKHTKSKLYVTNTVSYVNVETTFNVNEITVVCRQGSNQTEITNAFEMFCALNDGNISAIDKLKKTVATITGIGISGARIASGEVVGGATSLATTILGTIPNNNERHGKIVQTGNAIDTFTHKDFATGDLVKNGPYYLTQYTSLRDMYWHAIKYGITFNERLSSFASLFTSSFVTSVYSGQPAYVEMECNISGVNGNARRYIEQVLSQGVYIENIG